ncbi:unnamed protein product [Gordionus sp. m RMFG-2023]|uniref:arginine kinase-like n=1 Tax=Gordionus sp. m RMFG-2023 TaxID=3053472 RepID=UPI0030E4B481
MSEEGGVSLKENLLTYYDKLQCDPCCNSLLKQNFTKDVIEEIGNKVTNSGCTLSDCIKSGVENPDSSTGIYAADAESYTLFAPLFRPIIEKYHGSIKHPFVDFGNPETINFANLDPTGEYIISTRIRVGRNVEGYPFTATISRDQQEALETKIKEALTHFDGDLEGTYCPLPGMDDPTRDQLVEDHFLFQQGDRFLQSAGGYRNWPHGRGIFFNKTKTFLIWINEEDHLRIISMEQGANFDSVYKRLMRGIKILEQHVSFYRDDELGYLTFCPTNLGTTIRASVHIKIPKLSSQPNFKEFCLGLNLQVRGTHGEHTDTKGGVYDVSNKRRMGLTEIEVIREMYNGITQIIEKEKSL